MLFRSDLQLIRRDRGIPGLATLLDPEAFLAALRPQLPEIRLEKAVAHYVRYKPGTRCLVAYRLQLEHGEAAVYASAHGADARMKLQKVRERPGVRGTLGPGRIILRDHDVTVSVFPNDRILKTLAQLDGGDAQTRLVRRVVADRSELWDGDFECLAYKPERRYVAVLRGSQGTRAVFKFYDAEGFPAARGGARSFQSRGPLRIAGLLGRSKRKRVLALEWLPGRPLGDVFSDPERRREAVETTGTALAALHTQTPAGLPVSTRGAEAGALLAVAAEIGFLLPSIADRARDLAERVVELLLLEPPRGCPIHGDFYARQVLLTDGGVALLDLDEARYGDPAADLGNFSAHLEWADLPDAREELTEALLRGYRCAASPPPRAAIDLYTAAGLLRLAPHFFRSRQGDWAERTEAAVERAEALLSRLCRPPRDPQADGRPRSEAAAPSIPVEGSAELANDERLRFLQRALDPPEVQRQFDLQLSEALGRTLLRTIRVARHKPGRRCLIEYEIEAERDGSEAEVFTLIGKARADGLDSKAYRALETLWRAGFAADSEDRVSVPEPLGTLPDFHMWLQRKVPGVSATLLMAGPEGSALAVRIAEAAHKLHRTAVPTFRRHTVEDELRILHERLASVAAANPAWADRLDRILDACERLGAAIPKTRPIGIHRDFYADQVVVDGSRLYLVDFDLFCEGDPALDIGNFIGHLTEQSLRELGDPTALADRERALEERFLALAGEERRSAVGGYTTLTLVRHISISTRFPERRRITETLLELCEERLGIARSASRRLRRSSPARGQQAPGSRP